MNPYITAKRIDLYAAEFAKTATSDSYSSIMRSLDKKEKEVFQKAFKAAFDEALLSDSKRPEKEALEKAKPSIKKHDLKTTASSIDLGDPQYAGEYLAKLIKFLLRRISPAKMKPAIETMKKKVYYINEYDIAAKKIPASAAYGQAITLLKHLLIEHNPQYIRTVLNNIIRFL